VILMNSNRWLWPLAVANLVANIGIVVTGGAVRLTGSGLGCPTWPKCTDDRYVAHAATGWHGAIEFGNRMLTWVLVVIAIAFVVAAWKSGNRRLTRLGTWVALGVPAQAVLGGITVLTDLNPWVVSLHFMVSMAMIAICTVALDTLRGPEREDATPRARRIAVALFVVMWAVLYLGTIVTGSGPHAGDEDARRNGLSPEAWSRAHAWLVYVLCIGTVAMIWLARRSGRRVLATAATALLVVELLQGVIGYVQYFNGLPEILVGLHMLGAGLLATMVTWMLLMSRASDGGTHPRDVPQLIPLSH
jgi:heme a synthase